MFSLTKKNLNKDFVHQSCSVLEQMSKNILLNRNGIKRKHKLHIVRQNMDRNTAPIKFVTCECCNKL